MHLPVVAVGFHEIAYEVHFAVFKFLSSPMDFLLRLLTVRMAFGVEFDTRAESLP